MYMKNKSALYFDQWSELWGHARWRASTRRGASKDISASTSGHIGLFFRWIRLMPHIENPTNPNFLDFCWQISNIQKNWNPSLSRYLFNTALSKPFQRLKHFEAVVNRASGWLGSLGDYNKPWHKDPHCPTSIITYGYWSLLSCSLGWPFFPTLTFPQTFVCRCARLSVEGSSSV